MIISKDFCARSHTDRVYFGSDNAWHVEGSDDMAIQNGKHPQSKRASKPKRDKRDTTKSGKENKHNPSSGATVWSVDMLRVLGIDGKGRYEKQYQPSVKVEDRIAWQECNKDQNKRHHIAMKLLADADLRRKRIHKLEVKPGVWALDVVAYWDTKAKDWVAFTCEGYISK